MNRRHNLIYSALFAASAVAAPAAWAQVQDPPAPAEEYPSATQETAPAPDSTSAAAPGPSASTAPITDKKIEQFANAYVAVQSIQERAASDLQTAKDPVAQDKVKQNAESDMIVAVQKSGLQVDEFNQIVETMTADASVRERVAAKLQERTSGGGS